MKTGIPEITEGFEISLLTVLCFHKHARDMVGLIPGFLDVNDPRPAREQLDANYAHGGGWRPFEGFKLCEDHSIKYPGDPAYQVAAAIPFRSEIIYIYPHGWVMIQQVDGSYEIARMD